MASKEPGNGENSDHCQGESQLERSAEHQADGRANAGTRCLLQIFLRQQFADDGAALFIGGDHNDHHFDSLGDAGRCTVTRGREMNRIGDAH